MELSLIGIREVKEINMEARCDKQIDTKERAILNFKDKPENGIPSYSQTEYMGLSINKGVIL